MSLIIDYHSYGRAYNIWRDKCVGFRREYADHVGFSAVINTTLDLLNANLSDNGGDQAHPFRKFADADKTGLENFHALALAVMHDIQEDRLRQYVHSFFHSGGVNYPEMLEILDEYMLFADRAEDPDWITHGDPNESDDDDSQDSDDDDDDSVIDITGEPDDIIYDANAPPTTAMTP